MKHVHPPETAEPPFIRRGTPAYRAASWSLLIGGLVTFNLLYCVQPLMPVFSRDFGVGADDTALALSLSMGVLAVSLLFAAPIADRVGRKPMMLASVTVSAILILVGCLLESWPAFLATRALLGLALGGLPAIAMTYLVEEIEPAALNATMGFYIGGNALGGVLSRLMNSVLADLISWRAALAISGALGLMGAVVMWRLLPRSRVFTPIRRLGRSPRPSYLQHLGDHRILLLLAEGALLSGILVTTLNLLGYRLVADPFRLPLAVTSLMFASYLLGAPTTIVAGRLSAKVGRLKMIGAGLLVIVLGVGLMFMNSLPLIAGGLGLLIIGFFAAHSSASALVSAVTVHGQAQAASLYLFCFYGGSGLISWLGGHLWVWGRWPAVSAYLFVLASAALLGLAGLRCASELDASTTSK